MSTDTISPRKVLITLYPDDEKKLLEIADDIGITKRKNKRTPSIRAALKFWSENYHCQKNGCQILGGEPFERMK